jgi:hypothetical protein
MKTLDQFTFGKTPAALYLVRALESQEPTIKRNVVRSCSVRIRNFNNNVRDIMSAVDGGFMSAHTAANLFRILRDDATKLKLDQEFEDKELVLNLLRNVVIGNIKSAMRKTSVLRKIEVKSASLEKLKKSSKQQVDGLGYTEFLVEGLPAGFIAPNGEFIRDLVYSTQVNDPVTPEILTERSWKRCVRQNKPHTIEK